MSHANASFSLDEYIKQLQHENTLKELEFEKERKKIIEMEKIIKMRKILLKKLEKKLKEVSIQMAELNLCAQELGRKVRFSLDLAPCYLEDESALYSLDEIIRVKIMNEDVNHLFFWDLNKLNDRLYLIRDMLDKFFETETIEQVEKENDPFWDPEEPVDFGRAFISLKHVALLFDIERCLMIYYETETIGSVQVRIEPCDSLGQPLSSEETALITDPLQMLGKTLNFSVRIGKANINSQFTKYCYFQYRFGHDMFNGQTFTTSKVQSDSGIIDFEYFEIHTIDYVDNSSLAYLTSSKLDLHFFSKLTYLDALIFSSTTENMSPANAEQKV